MVGLGNKQIYLGESANISSRSRWNGVEKDEVVENLVTCPNALVRNMELYKRNAILYHRRPGVEKMGICSF